MIEAELRTLLPLATAALEGVDENQRGQPALARIVQYLRSAARRDFPGPLRAEVERSERALRPVAASLNRDRSRHERELAVAFEADPVEEAPDGR